jgi:hypothetical protein
VEALIQAEEPQRTDGPDWMFEAEETSTRDPSYIFCPPQHCAQILRIFTRTFVWHPFFPERNGEHSTGEQIRRETVLEMYQFCKARDLQEVWGYMWACWYRPKTWPLWARSADPDRLSRLRTTMTVENHWKEVKHTHLHHLVHPRLDQLIYILIYEVTPSIDGRLRYLDPMFHLGQARPVSTWQKHFKKSWETLSKREVSGNDYQTNVAR